MPPTRPPLVKSALKDPRFVAMMAAVKGAATGTGKLLAAGADHCYTPGQYESPDRLVQLRRVATRLVLEDLTDGVDAQAGVVCVLLGSLSGLVERSGPGLRKDSRVQFICKTDMPVRTALGALAARDPAAAAAVSGWIVSAVNDREDDANRATRERFVRHAKEGLKAPSQTLADMLAPLKWPAMLAGGAWLASKFWPRGR